MVSAFDFAAEGGAGDHNAVPLDDECPVDGQSEIAARSGFFTALQGLSN
jgi:hypothetical protein